MLNAERFKKEILDHMDKKNTGLFGVYNRNSNIFFECKAEKCQNCIFDNAVRGDFKKSCTRAKIEWLLSEYNETVKLSTLEHELLRHLYKKDYRYIAREKSERMFAYKGRPFKVFGHSWNIAHGEKLGFLNLYDFSYLFQFVNWEDEQPTSIKEVLNNCEVIDDDQS